MSTILILHNIRSAQNVGSIFRTADGAGAKEIILTGYTPAPIDRFGRVRSDIAKAALGAENTVSWRQEADTASVIAQLKEAGVEVVAVEQDARAINYRDHKAQEEVAFIFGNEVEGIESAVLDVCDAVIDIPMRGTKESLNVAVAAGIILFNTNYE